MDVALDCRKWLSRTWVRPAATKRTFYPAPRELPRHACATWRFAAVKRLERTGAVHGTCTSAKNAGIRSRRAPR